MDDGSILESIAKSAVGLSNDQPAAVAELDALLGRFAESEVCRSNASLAELATKTREIARRMSGSGGDELKAMTEALYRAIDRLLSTASMVDMGGDSEAASVAGSDDQVDEDLLRTWIESSDGALADLEAAILRLEQGFDQASTDSARRIIHTLKGESGVIPAPGLGAVLHEAESTIDRWIERGGAFPAPVFLGVVDWFRKVLGSADASTIATVPPDPELLAQVKQACGGEVAAEVEDASKAWGSSSPAGTPMGIEADAGLTASATDAADEPATPDGGAVGDAVVEAPAPALDAAESDAPVGGFFDTGAGDASEAASAVDAAEPDAPVGGFFDTGAGEATAAPASGLADDDGLVHVHAEMDDMLREFIAESREHFAASEQALLELESSPDEKELIDVVFRAFHTIKGVAGFLNLEPIVELAHKAEFLLDAARTGKVVVTSSFLDRALAACDLLSVLIASLEGGDPPTRAAYDSLLASLDEALRGAGQGASGGSASSEPRLALASADEGSEGGFAPGGVPAKSGGAGGGSGGSAAAQRLKRQADHTIKVNTLRLDSLVDMVGELVIGHQMVVQDPEVEGLTEQRTQRNLVHVGKIIRDLQEVAMSLRMITLRGPFQKMARLVRDLATKSGKQISLRIEGEDTELDRNVVDEIGDPLVHMIRNACDHGIETPAERVAAGKDPQGTLTLRAFHKGGSIVIEVEDDGRGLHRDKILNKAMERGVIPADIDPKDLSDDEVHQLLFAPGFSTAEKVTDVSGRGVGMDVVKRNIESLRGKCEIRSVPGRGSTFVLSLPLTMAIIDGMVVRVGNQRYVVPTLSIEQSFRPKADELSMVMGRGETVMVRGDLLPVYRLNDLFGLEEGNRDLAETLLVVIESNTHRACLQVDELLGQQQVVIKSLGRGIGRVGGVSGGAILGDGRVAPILDVAGLLSQVAQDGAARSMAITQGAVR